MHSPRDPAQYAPLDRIAREPDALEAFYRDHVEAVRRFVARRVSDPHLAADLTADVFLAAVEIASSYDSSRGPVVAWLYGVGRNAIAAEARRRVRELHAVRRIEGAVWSTAPPWPGSRSVSMPSASRAGSTGPSPSSFRTTARSWSWCRSTGSRSRMRPECWG